MDLYSLGKLEAANTFGVEKRALWLPLAIGGLAAQTVSPFAYGAEGAGTAPEGDETKRGLTQAGAALLGGVIGNVVGPTAGVALHALMGAPPKEAFITAAMMKHLLGGLGSIGGGEMARRYFKDAPANLHR